MTSFFCGRFFCGGGITIPSVGKGYVGGAADLERGQAALDGVSARHGNVVPTH